jgi:SAM-dependent methyltransferase
MLDIGCGRGLVTAIAARHARRVVAADLAGGAAEATRRVLADHPFSTVVVADVFGGTGAAWRKRGVAFDAILLSEVLEHLDEDVAPLLRCRELLSPGGHLVVTVPANPKLWTEWDDLAGHRRRYTRKSLVSVLTSAGFRVTQITSWGFPLTGWLAVRGARMRGRRVAEHHAGGEVPGLVERLMPAASIVFKAAAHIEPWLSFLDKGAGYVVVAERVDSAEMRLDAAA